MKEIVELVGQWLTLPDVAEELDVDIRRVHRLLDERAIISVRIGERNIRSIPGDFLQDGSVVESLKGTLSVLLDAGYSDEESISWLFTDDDSLPGTPMNALRSGRKTEIRRRAQALAW
ncbi:Rv2175c family DNA-binding protein [Glutamicibacter halophytocola]|uniref:Rv2175c family DNA-binding protein n=1 Tax=Glutamicibacter halophytocola TaxID=1933880 RepID=UPI0015C54873|nr:Rv2175c family DNA-binding protein [Glutamicibacter halophytocola]NQD39478.1 DNA-binding protein [Glutamicibacter halophytocola]